MWWMVLTASSEVITHRNLLPAHNDLRTGARWCLVLYGRGGTIFYLVTIILRELSYLSFEFVRGVSLSRWNPRQRKKYCDILSFKFQVEIYFKNNFIVTFNSLLHNGSLLSTNVTKDCMLTIYSNSNVATILHSLFFLT